MQNFAGLRGYFWRVRKGTFAKEHYLGDTYLHLSNPRLFVWKFNKMTVKFFVCQLVVSALIVRVHSSRCSLFHTTRTRRLCHKSAIQAYAYAKLKLSLAIQVLLKTKPI